MMTLSVTTRQSKTKNSIGGMSGFVSEIRFLGPGFSGRLKTCWFHRAQSFDEQVLRDEFEFWRCLPAIEAPALSMPFSPSVLAKGPAMREGQIPSKLVHIRLHTLLVIMRPLSARFLFRRNGRVSNGRGLARGCSRRNL
jgi:hypothetical protein